MRITLNILFLFFTSFLFAQQNLVTNPSFEEYSNCPHVLNLVNFALGWSSYNKTPDYYNSCSGDSSDVFVPLNCYGNQNAHSGNAYCGLYSYVWLTPDYREYIGSELAEPLNINQKYYVSLQVNLAESVNCGTNNLGILFSTKPYSDSIPMTIHNHAQIYSLITITDTMNWVAISGSFISDSAYRYIIVGNFYDSTHTTQVIINGSDCVSYYFIDDICVSDDSSYCANYNYSETNEIKEFSGITIYPNPAKDELIVNIALIEKSSFELFDIWGAKRKVVHLDNYSTAARINISELNNGLYLYSICDKKGNKIKSGKLVIQK
jgi:hypothetical protein